MPTDEELSRERREQREQQQRDEEFSISRAEIAKRILEEPMLNEAFDYIEAEYVRALQVCDLDDASAFKHARMQIENIRELKRQLQHVLDTGTMMAFQRDERHELEAKLRKDQVENG